MSEEQDSYTKTELLQQLDDLAENFESDVNNAEGLHERFARQDTLFLNTAGNDDGNEDRPETFDEDGDHVQGMERGEELIRLERYLENAPAYRKDIEELRAKIETTNQQEVIDSLVEVVEDLQDTLENIRPEDLDTGSFN